MQRSLGRIHLLLTATVLGVLALAPASAHAAPFVVTETSDSSPGIAVDAAGTAHLAWGTRTGSAFPYSYQVTYCQIPRGGTACTNTEVIPNPGNLNNFGNTQVLIKDSQVVILQSMCCGGGEGTIMRKSTDGGLTFPPPSFKVFTEPSGWSLFRSAQNAAGTGAMVINYNSTRAGFIAYDGGQFAASPPQHGGGEISGAGDVGWLNSTQPFMTQMGYLTNHLFTRFFNTATTGFNTGGNWLPSTQVDTKVTESAIATGPSGAFIAATTTVDHPFGKDEIAFYRVSDTGVTGTPIPLIQETDPAHSPTNLDLAQDDGGRLHAVWTDAGFDGKLYYEWSNDGVTWAPPALIQVDPAKGGYDNRIAVAPDGGGWVMTDGNGAGPITLAPLEPKGSSAPPTRVKPAPIPQPEPAPACPTQIKVSADASAVVRSGGCFTGKAPTYKTTGAIRVGGIDLVPQGSGTLTVNTSSNTIVSSGKTKYEIRAGASVLARSTIDWNVAQPKPISGVGAFGVKLFGLGVTGKADIWFTKGEGRVQVNLDLPSPLDAVNANTILRTTMADGLIVDGFAVDGHDVPIGPVTVTKFNLAYSSGADTLEGAFSMKLPPGASDNVSGGIGLANGAFKHAELEIGPGVPPLPLPLWATPPVTLNRIGASASNDAKGFTMAGKVAIVAGGEIAGAAIVGVDGSLQLFVPSSRAYAQIRAQGDVKIVGVPLGGGFVQIRSDGPLTFGGSMGIDFDIVEASFKTAGGIDLSNGDFYASGEAKVGVSLVVIKGELKASSIVSSRGLAACGQIKGTIPKTGLSGSVELGYQKEWGKDSELGGCEIDKYIPASLKGGAAMVTGFGTKAFDPLARAAQTPAGTLTLKAGTMAGVKVTGAGGRPGFTFAGPSGRTITVPANITEPVIEPTIAAIPVGPDSVELQVKNPKGSWTVAADGAAPAVAQVFSAGVLPTPKTTASVRRGSGNTRVVRVKTSNLGSQSLILRELLPDGAANEIGRITANGSKRFTFTPAIAAGGRRTIEAVIVNGAKVSGTKKVASYIAPAAVRLPAPRRVTLARKRAGRSAVTVRWAAVTGAAGYRVFVSGTDGRREFFATKRTVTKLALPNVTYDDKLTIRVQALPKFGAAGTAKTATSKAVKLRKASKKKTK